MGHEQVTLLADYTSDIAGASYTLNFSLKQREILRQEIEGDLRALQQNIVAHLEAHRDAFLASSITEMRRAVERILVNLDISLRLRDGLITAWDERSSGEELEELILRQRTDQYTRKKYFAMLEE